jgi:hypothetical protein
MICDYIAFRDLDHDVPKRSWICLHAPLVLCFNTYCIAARSKREQLVDTMAPNCTNTRGCVLSRVLLLCFLLIQSSSGTHPAPFRPFGIPRGGASPKSKSAEDGVYDLVARVFQEKFDDVSDRDQLTKALKRLASSQQTFKGLDGAAHEAYQRTHAGNDIDASVSGRAQRSAARMAATAEALLACEFIELLQHPELVNDETFVSRRVLLNSTNENVTLANTNLSVLVLYEESYAGGAGLEHGSIDDLTDDRRLRRPKGRLLIILSDSMTNDLVRTLQILDKSPHRVKLTSGLISGEVVSVQPALYRTAGDLLQVLEPLLRAHNTSAIHFVGQSLAGGVASLAATILDGTLPMPKSKPAKGKRRSKSKSRRKKTEEVTLESSHATFEPNNSTGTNETVVIEPLNGLGCGRSSALTLGAPPCLSSNILAAFCTSFMYGDDVVCRTSPESIERLYKRMDKHIHGGIIGRNMGWMTDTVSLTVSNLKSHAHGSEGEEVKLAVPGRAYLVRPRRLGGMCSIHEVGNLKKGGREALRAGLLWQLYDILLSKSMWKHHELESYIQGLDRVQLRGTGEDAEDHY